MYRRNTIVIYWSVLDLYEQNNNCRFLPSIHVGSDKLSDNKTTSELKKKENPKKSKS